jgi:hypothetical protein
VERRPQHLRADSRFGGLREKQCRAGADENREGSEDGRKTKDTT